MSASTDILEEMHSYVANNFKSNFQIFHSKLFTEVTPRPDIQAPWNLNYIHNRGQRSRGFGIQ